MTTTPTAIRNELKRWMLAVLEEKDWTANRWATEAGISATSITRFLKDSNAFLPSYSTLTKLADAANVAMPAFKQAQSGVTKPRTIPLYAVADIVRNRGIKSLKAKAEMLALIDGADLFAVELSDGRTAVCEPADNLLSANRVVWLTPDDVIEIARYSKKRAETDIIIGRVRQVIQSYD